MGRIIFITGGAKSGKSSFALSLAGTQAAGTTDGLTEAVFIATLHPFDDDEMKKKIALHQAERPSFWRLSEIDYNFPVESMCELIKKNSGSVILIDCLTLWLSNIISTVHEERWEQAVTDASADLADALKATSGTFIVVSNETGMGIVPENRLARTFRDFSGQMNKIIAKTSDEAYIVVSGLPLRLK